MPINTVIRAELNNFLEVQKVNSGNSLGLLANASFGTSSTLAIGNDEIFIGAPGPNTVGYQDGQVYRFTNTGVSYNTTLVDLTVATGFANIIINDQVVQVSNIANVTSVVSAIDNLIIGLTPSKENGNLRLDYTSSISGDVLNVLVTNSSGSLIFLNTLLLSLN